MARTTHPAPIAPAAAAPATNGHAARSDSILDDTPPRDAEEHGSDDLFPGEADGRAAVPVPVPDEFAAAHGEPLAAALDLGTWTAGPDFQGFYSRLRDEVAGAVRSETRRRAAFRRAVFPQLRFRDGAPPDAGVWRTTPGDLAGVHRRVLFNGGVEACDGTVAVLDTVPVTVTQAGLCLVSYHGTEGTWGHRLFRRDLRESAADPVEEALAVLDRRGERERPGRQGSGRRRDRLSGFARAGILAYAERAALLDRSTAPWRMGHGSPCPYELMTGSGLVDLLRQSLELMRRLIDYGKFVFVAGGTEDRALLTLGNALRPLEYVIVEDIRHKLRAAPGGAYRGEWGGEMKEEVLDFIDDYGPRVVVGLYRAGSSAPPRVFYAHRDFAHPAALIALADSVLQEHRGFPLLLDLAKGLCRTTYGGGPFAAAARLAYAEAGEPFRYLNDR